MNENRIREVVYQADELADDLRAFLNLLNEGKIEEARNAIKEWIVKLRS